MKPGFIMLVHEALHRAGQVARYWASAGFPVVIHVDRRVPKARMAALQKRLTGLDNVRFCRRHACEWGTWSLVAAMQSAAETLLKEFPEASHVVATSGSCLPLRPADELAAYLADRPGTDFIESVTTADVAWTVGGIDYERFVLYFPFSWRRQRRLFDFAVALQRRLSIRRRLPPRLVPHLGSQWWCLTRETLTRILQDPDRRRHEAYFRYVWIPDESYFQSLVRLHSDRIDSRSLTLSKFDFQGKPHVFYDDHLQLLRRSDCFLARKIWPEAERLYGHFLSRERALQPRAEPNPARIDRLFARATEQRTRGRPGLYSQSRYPLPGRENGKTAGPYSVFEGFSALFEGFETWLGRHLGSRVHGHLFAPQRVEFAGGDKVYHGALSDSAALRDYDADRFLTNLIWATRGERQCFQFGPRDNQAPAWMMATDANAQISVISGAWAVALWRSRRDFAELRRDAASLQRIETEHLEILRSPWAKARVRIWTLAEFMENPMENLQGILEEIDPQRPRRPTEAPRMVQLDGFAQFLQKLRNEGMQPTLTGDFPAEPGPFPETAAPTRPRLVR